MKSESSKIISRAWFKAVILPVLNRRVMDVAGFRQIFGKRLWLISRCYAFLAGLSPAGSEKPLPFLETMAARLKQNIQFHGFLTQGFFHRSENNMYGQCVDGISPDRTEIGLDANYQPFDWLCFTAQSLYRRTGDVEPGSIRLYFGLVELTLLEYGSGKFGLRWDITPSWMLRGEYHRIHGTAWLPQADNPEPGRNVHDWDLSGLQLPFRC